MRHNPLGEGGYYPPYHLSLATGFHSRGTVGHAAVCVFVFSEHQEAIPSGFCLLNRKLRGTVLCIREEGGAAGKNEKTR
jgi:hypothetical protein